MAFGPDSETYLNPLDLSDVSELLETTQLAYKIEAVLALSAASMAEGNEGLSDVERSIISRCVEKAYLTCGRNGAVPQLQDLYDILRQQPEPEAEIVALRFERYVSGALSIFNHQSNVAFDRRITCVGLKDLPDNMRAFGIDVYKRQLPGHVDPRAQRAADEVAAWAAAAPHAAVRLHGGPGRPHEMCIRDSDISVDHIFSEFGHSVVGNKLIIAVDRIYGFL